MENELDKTDTENTGATPTEETPQETTPTPEQDPAANSGTPATNMEGGTQALQESTGSVNFDKQVSDTVNAQQDVTGDAPHFPGGVYDERQHVLNVGYDKEMDQRSFDDLLEKVVVNDEASGAASVTFDDGGYDNDGKHHGLLRARLIGDSASRVYVFRHDDKDSKTTTFTAKFTATA